MAKKQESMRVREADINKAIFRPKGENPKVEILEGDITYTLFGKHDELIDDYPTLWDADNGKIIILAHEREEACARKAITANRIRYYIKRDNSGKLFNPLAITGNTNHQKDKKRTTTSNRADGTVIQSGRFVEVNKNIFSMYLKFLRTKNQAWLLNAERERI
jgi:hypothetical protein